METVIFDMDGVIINSEPIHYEILSGIFNNLGFTLSKEEYSKFVGTSSRSMWRIIKEKYSLNQSLEELLHLGRDEYFSFLRDQDISPVPGIEKLLQEAKELNNNIILASSSSMENIELVLKVLNLEFHFDHKISGAELENPKPHPEIFTKAASMVNSKPEKCLVIEDSENGVKAAKAAGMKCIGYLNPDSGDQNLKLADWIYDDLRDVSLKKLKKKFWFN